MFRLRAFLRDKSGSIPVIGSLVMLSFVGVAGAAMDYSTAAQQKSALQSMVDSAATGLALDPTTINISADELNKRALALAQATGANSRILNLQITATANRERVSIDGSGMVATVIGRLFGLDYAAVSAAVTVERTQVSKLEIALALDNTGSMEGEKMKQLKAAVRLFLDRMEQLARKPGDVRIAMIPFGTHVRTDPALMNANWLSETPPKKWNGCVTDRDKPHDTTDDSPVGAASRLFTPADNDECGKMAAILPLTDDFTKLRARVDNLVADGSTNITIGMAWGMHALSPGAPLTEGKTADEVQGLTKVLILLTDGNNTRNRWTSDEDQIDVRTKLACRNAKDAGYIVYTIRLINGNEQLLRDCASSAQNYISVKKASDLPDLFSNLAGTMSGLRISR